MRDIVIALIIFGGVPVALFQPYVGVLLWSWISYMNPHRLTFGFAHDFPFAAVIGGATLLGLLFTRDRQRLPMMPITMVWLLFVVWMCFTTLFALHPDDAFLEWKRTMKIMLIAFATVMLMARRDRLHLLIWVIVLSLGFYAVKGALFTLTHDTGGLNLVWGPEGSFIEDNNALAFALIMTLPLMRYLHLVTENKWIKRGLLAMMLLTVIAIVGSHSRGALLAGVAIGLYFWFKSDNRFRIAVALVLIGALVAAIAPPVWVERMETIRTYEQDPSAMGRINAWWVAVNLTKDRPIVGGGFSVFQEDTFARYAPEPENVHDSHSIYFEVLGEHGYVGLVLFLFLGVLALRNGKWIMRTTRDRPDLKWAGQLAAMLQVSLIGYATGGAFLGLAYFDLYYHLVAMLIITRILVEQALQPNAVSPFGVKAGAERLSSEYP